MREWEFFTATLKCGLLVYCDWVVSVLWLYCGRKMRVVASSYAISLFYRNKLVVLTKEYLPVHGQIKGIPVVTVNALQHCVQRTCISI